MSTIDMSTPTRVAYLCEFPTLLGGERSLLVFLARRAPAGVEPVVVAPAHGALAATLAAEGIAHVAWGERGRQDADAVAPQLRDRGIELVHANSMMTADAALALGAALGTPAVAHVRDMMRLSAARRDRLAQLAGLIAVSDAVAAWLVGQGIPQDRVTRIYNAVDVDALAGAARPGALRAELGLPSGASLIGCIGQIALRKGQDVFLAAAAQVAASTADAHFVIAGARYSEKAESRAFEADLHRRAAAPPLAGRTHLLGERDDIPSVLADLDVLVVPSRQEPLSRVLLEGLALGVPAVATAVGGTPEILACARCGATVPPDDADALAAAIISMADDDEAPALARRAGPARIRAAFSPDRQVAAMRAFYDRIVAP